MRIAKFIADAGIASRRGAEKLIEQGRVQVGGRVISSPALDVAIDDRIMVDGQLVVAGAAAELYAFYKPLDVIVSASDPAGRCTIYDVLPAAYRHLKYVGRLDYKTDGLLLLTNSGDLARELTLPSREVRRVYVARVSGWRAESQLDAPRRGIVVAGVKYRPMKIRVKGKNDEIPSVSFGCASPFCAGRKSRGNDNYKLLEIEIVEGKNREIRKVMNAVGLDVVALRRVVYGDVKLGDMKVGEVKLVKKS